MRYDRERLAEMVSRCKWNWASSMIEVPHEYIHRDHCELTRSEFYYFVSAQRETGIFERWGPYTFPYLYLDGYKYWTMGDPFPTTFILNRQKVFGEFDFLDWPIPRLYTENEFRTVAFSVIKNFSGKIIFECGIGDGDFVALTDVTPERYYAVDPSKKAINNLRSIKSGFFKRCSSISFEESVSKWLSSNCVVVALFGSASYFMKPYLQKLSYSGKDYFLMFYNEGFNPEEFKEMHHFAYSKEELKDVFRSGYFYNSKNFLTITSKKIEWFVPPKQNELFPVR